MNQDPNVLLKEAYAALIESLNWGMQPTDEMDVLLMNIEAHLGLPPSKTEIEEEDDPDVIAMTIDEFLDSITRGKITREKP